MQPQEEAPHLDFTIQRQPYGQHSVSVLQKLRLLSRARSFESSRTLAPRQCFMMSLSGNVIDKGLASSEVSAFSLIPRPAWMRETSPHTTDEEADRNWHMGTSRLFGNSFPLEPSSFTGGNTLKATVDIQHPHTGKHRSRVALDTQSDVTTCLREFLTDVHTIVPDVVSGCGGAANFEEEGTLLVYSHQE
jgi:hypothetical protein